MNGRRSLYMKRSTRDSCISDEIELRLDQIFIEGLRFFAKYSINTNMDTEAYFRKLSKNYDPVSLKILQHIIEGTKNLKLDQQIHI